MASSPRLRLGSDESGLTSVGILLAVGFTLIIAMVVVNLFLYLYGQGVARAAIDEGVRAGSRVTAEDGTCRDRAYEVRDNLMPGPLGEGTHFDCQLVGDELVATADVTLDSPLPGIPSWSFVMEARAVKETGE